MISPIVLVFITIARIVLDFDPEAFGEVKTSISQTTSQAAVGSVPLPFFLPSNVCPRALPIQRVNPRPVTTLNDVARTIAQFGHEYTEESALPSPTDDTPSASLVILYNPSYITSVYPVKAFTSPVSETPVYNGIETEFGSMYLFVRYWFQLKLKPSHLRDALSLIVVSAVFATYILLAKASWDVHYDHEDLYGPAYVTLTRKQYRKINHINHQYKRRQQQEHIKHVEDLKYFQSVFNHGVTIVTGYKARLADETRQNVEITRTLAIQTSLCADQSKDISSLERVNKQLEHMNKRRLDDIDALNQHVRNSSELTRAKERELDVQRDLINRLKDQIREDEIYYMRQKSYLCQGDFDLKMEDARRIQHDLETAITKKDAVIDHLKAQVVSMKDEMGRINTELEQMACNQAQVDSMAGRMDRMRMEIAQLKSGRETDQQIILVLKAKSASSKEETLADSMKAESEIEQLKSDRKVAEQSIAMLKAENALLVEKTQTDALRKQLEMEQLQISRKADEQTIATLLAESASLSEKSTRDDQEIARLNSINATQGLEMKTMSAMLDDMSHVVNSPGSISEGSTDVSSVSNTSVSDVTATTVVEAGGSSLAELLSEVEATRREIMDVVPKETPVDQPSLALPDGCIPSSEVATTISHDQLPFSWDFTNVPTLSFDAEIPGISGGPQLFDNPSNDTPIQNHVMDEVPSFLGSAEDIWNAAMTLDSPQFSTTVNGQDIAFVAPNQVMADVSLPSGAIEGMEIVPFSQTSMQLGCQFAPTDPYQQPSTRISVAPTTFENTSNGSVVILQSPMEVEQTLAPTTSQSSTTPNPFTFNVLSPAIQLDNTTLGPTPLSLAAPNHNQFCNEQPVARGFAAAAWAANPSGSRPIRKIKQGLRSTAPRPPTVPSLAIVENTTPEVLYTQVADSHTPITTPNSIVVDTAPEAVVTSDADVFRSTAKPLGRRQAITCNAPPITPVAGTSGSNVTSSGPKKPVQPKPRGRSVLSVGPGGKLSVTTRG